MTVPVRTDGADGRLNRTEMWPGMTDRTQRTTTRRLLLLALAAALLTGGCSGGRETAGERARYQALRSDAIALYLGMHPLRGSRLGCRASDSLLYTYSAEEMRLSRSRLSGLEGNLRTLSTAGLDVRQIENSRLLLSWIRGERYALSDLRFYRFNPLLYCWILEETLWSIPLRIDPPYEGELEAYGKRRERIPALLRNAAVNIENPSRPHVELASQRIRRLLENLPALERVIYGRYGRTATLPDSVARSITGFLGFLEGTLSSQTRGNMILGTENIAKIFRYGEMIELDPAGLIQEADKQIRRLRSELASLQRGGTAETPEEGTSLQQVLGMIAERDAGTGFTKSRPHEIGLKPGPGRQTEPSKNVNLGIPEPESTPVSLVSTSPLSANPCTQSLRYDENRSNELLLLYHALRALSTRREERRLCTEADSVRALLGSELYTQIVRFLEIDDLIDEFPAERPSLRIMLVREKIRALARMTVLFEIHAGTMTTGAAIDYLEKTAALGAEEAAAAVMAATYAPATAHTGIALLYLDRMIKKAAEKRDSTGPEKRVLRVLEERYYLPPTVAIRYLEP
jgi:hypothetical protein